MSLPDFTPGKPLSARALSDWQDAGRAGRVVLDGSSGLVGVSAPSGQSARKVRKIDGWFKITGTGTEPGSYELTEQVDLPDGDFADGPLVRDGWPTPGSSTPPTDGTATVRAFRVRSSIRFEWGSC